MGLGEGGCAFKTQDVDSIVLLSIVVVTIHQHLKRPTTSFPAPQSTSSVLLPSPAVAHLCAAKQLAIVVVAIHQHLDLLAHKALGKLLPDLLLNGNNLITSPLPAAEHIQNRGQCKCLDSAIQQWCSPTCC